MRHDDVLTREKGNVAAIITLDAAISAEFQRMTVVTVDNEVEYEGIMMTEEERDANVELLDRLHFLVSSEGEIPHGSSIRLTRPFVHCPSILRIPTSFFLKVSIGFGPMQQLTTIWVLITHFRLTL